MSVDVFFYRVNEFRHAAEHSITNSFLSDLSEPAFNDVQLGTTGGNEVHVEAFVSLQPGLHLRMFVRCVVVNDQVKIQV